MSTMLFCRPDEIVTYGFTTTGTVDSDYEPDWLTDAIPGRPVKAAGGSPAGLSLDMTGTAGEVGIIAIHHHNLIVPVTIGGDISATITPAVTRPPNGIQLNPYTLISPAVSGVDHLTFSVSGNDQDEIIGELLAGKLREFTPIRIDGAEFTHDDFADEPQGAFVSVMPYDKGTERRRLVGSQFYSLTDLNILKGWWQSQRSGTKPSLLIPDPDLNDAWVVNFKGFRYRPYPKDTDLYLVSFEFVEYPRSRW